MESNNMKENFSWEFSLKNNTIFLYGEIDTPKAELITAQLFYLDANKVDEITIYINCSGGSITDGLSIRNAINSVNAKVITIGTGYVGGIGVVLLSSGSKGYRKATSDCEIMLHQPMGASKGQASDIIIESDHIQRVKNRLIQILSDNTGKSTEQIKIDTDRNLYLSSKDALEYGLIDEVLTEKNKAKGEE